MLKANASVLLHITTVLGLFSVFCSAMIYIDTRRTFWQRDLTFTKFFGATFLLGTTCAAMLLAWTAALATPALGETARAFAIAAMIIRTALFGWEFQNFQRTLADDTDPNHRSALTVWRLLRPLAYARVGLFAGSTLFAILAIAGAGWLAALAATASASLTTLAVFAERYTFFTAVVAPRMPGPLTPRSS